MWLHLFFSGYTPLHTTVEQNDMNMMVSLIKHGANIDGQVGARSTLASTFTPMFVNRTLPSLKLDTSTDANKDFSLK